MSTLPKAARYVCSSQPAAPGYGSEPRRFLRQSPSWLPLDRTPITIDLSSFRMYEVPDGTALPHLPRPNGGPCTTQEVRARLLQRLCHAGFATVSSMPALLARGKPGRLQTSAPVHLHFVGCVSSARLSPSGHLATKSRLPPSRRGSTAERWRGSPASHSNQRRELDENGETPLLRLSVAVSDTHDGE